MNIDHQTALPQHETQGASPLPGNMAVWFDRIVKARRSVYEYRDADVPRSIIEKAIEHALTAPNHHRNNPWRFHVFSKDGRQRLANAYESAARRLGLDVQRARQRAWAAPAMIAVASIHDPHNAKTVDREDDFATAAATQNLLLSLASEGIGSLITTGALPESSEVQELLGLDPATGTIMGVIWVGYADPNRRIPPKARLPQESFRFWTEFA